MKTVQLVWLALAWSLSISIALGQGTDCYTATRFCTTPFAPLVAGVNQPTPPQSNNYDCLGTQPNPVWYYIEISHPGDLNFFLSNTNNVDIDFILWGPFPNVATAKSQCGNLGNGGISGAIEDCSYSASATENLDIVFALPGEVYMLLITNFSNQPTVIEATQIGGTGVAVCDCQVNATATAMPGFNQDAIIAQSNHNVDLVLCPEDSFSLRLSFGAQDIGDSLYLAMDSSWVQAFPNSDLTILPDTLVDSMDIVLQFYPSAGQSGNTAFTLSLWSVDGVDTCVTPFQIRTFVPGISDCYASPHVLCASNLLPIHLESEFASPAFSLVQTQNLVWSQVFGPPLAVSDSSIANPLLSIPISSIGNHFFEFEIAYETSINNGALVCIIHDTAKIQMVEPVINISPTDTICAGEMIQLEAHYNGYFANNVYSGPCGATSELCWGTSAEQTVGASTYLDSYVSPYYGFYEDARFQMIVLASELSAAGMLPGLITEIAFHVSTKNSAQPYSNFSIKMGCTNADSMPINGFISTPMVEVYAGTPTIVAGWNSHSFQTNYEWDGVSNLLVEICFDNDTWTGTDLIVCTTTADFTVQYNYSDGNSGCSLSGYHRSKARPDVRFTNCAGAQISNYQWSAPLFSSTDSILTVAPYATTDYLVTASLGNFCTATDTVHIEVLTALPAPVVQCDTVGMQYAQFSWAAVPGAVQYEYSRDSGATWTTTTATTISFGDQPVSLLVRGDDGSGACSLGAAGSALCWVPGSCVYPGDADNNTIVQNTDLFYLGLGMGETGSSRLDQALDYSCKLAVDWANSTPLSAINYKYSDTDGNGVITADDTLAIHLNWGQVHTRNGGGGLPGDIPLYIEIPTCICPLHPGQTMGYPLMLGDPTYPATDAYGLAFSLYYDPLQVVPGSVYIDFNTVNWLGNTATGEALAMQRNFASNGELQAALTRTDHLPRTGAGQIGTLYFTVRPDIWEYAYSTVQFLLTDTRLITHQEEELGTNAGFVEIAIGDSLSGLERLPEMAVLLFPNPAQEAFSIESGTDLQTAWVINALGQTIEQYIFHSPMNGRIDTRDWPEGVYTVEIQATDGRRKSLKVVIQR